jgi:deoxyadenosine/deoxycytidine kinase
MTEILHESNMIIWISGPTGSGKTSIAHLLEQVGYAIVPETVPAGLLREFSVEPRRNCARLQTEIMTSRLDGWKQVAASQHVAFDRSVDEDVDIFCTMHHHSGLLTDVELTELKLMAEKLRTQLPQPDLILFNRAAPAVLYSRLERAKAPVSIIETLPQQLSLYDEWAALRGEPVLFVDNSKCNLDILKCLFRS